MKKEIRNNIIGWTLTVIVLVLFCYGFYIVLIKSGIKGQQLCSEKLNIPYSWWDGSEPRMEFEQIDEEHYNCCYYKTHLTDEGYYEDKVCKGFKK